MQPIEKLPETINIALSGINVRPGRLRAQRPDVIKQLMESIHSQGLINAITVRPREGGGYWLLAGLQRFTAVKKLKERTIRAVILTGLAADQAELIEIDENLVRADLSPAERAVHMARRKELYERARPETKQGGDRKSASAKSKSQNENLKTFVADTATKTGKGRSTVARDVTRGRAVAVLSDIVGTSLDKGDEIDALAQLPPEEQRALADATKTGKRVSAKTRLKQIKRNAREQQLGAKQLAYPTKFYGLMLSDDEWDYEVWSRETGMDRHAANHYLTASDAHTAEEMHERTKARFECAAPDCLLAMWATVTHLAIGVDLLRMRGFRYVSHYVWGKDKAGKGWWNRNRHEVLLIGVKGNIPCPAPGMQWDSLIMAPRGEHSAKPECFLEMLEQYFPTLPKIELNRRGPPRPGWDAWGNEAETAPQSTPTEA
jgi:N6-adenosine-specific RNA methylase IME4